MRLSRFTTLCATVACVAVVLNVDGSAQRGGARSGAPGGQGGRAGAITPAAAAAAPSVADDPFSGPVVTNAPFSAEAVTTVTQVLGDGTRIEQKTTAKFYRDSAGRVRREQTILGLGALDPSAASRTTITIDPDPGDTLAYTLDPANRTARQVPRNSAAAGVNGVFLTLADNRERSALSVATGELTARRVTRVENGQVTVTEGVAQPTEQLGTKQVEGVAAVGRKTKSVIPAGQIGNDRPIEITDERWESAELRLLVRSHHHDPRTGDVEYRLTNIVRSEPPADLFMVPSDYQIQSGGRGGGNPDGGLGRGGGGRARSGGGGQ